MVVDEELLEIVIIFQALKEIKLLVVLMHLKSALHYNWIQFETTCNIVGLFKKALHSVHCMDF